MKSPRRSARIRIGVWYALSCLGPIIQSVWADQQWAGFAFFLSSCFGPLPSEVPLGDSFRHNRWSQILFSGYFRIINVVAYMAFGGYLFVYLGLCKGNRLDPFMAAFICLLLLPPGTCAWVVAMHADEEALARAFNKLW